MRTMIFFTAGKASYSIEELVIYLQRLNFDEWGVNANRLKSIVSISTKDSELTENLVIDKAKVHGLFLVSTNKQEILNHKFIFNPAPIFN